MSKVMVTIRCPAHRPSLKEVEDHYGLAASEVDKDFGVVEIDPRQHLFTILVEPEAAMRIVGTAGDWQAEGPFANPPIAPMGPPR